jgi:hypothetical protein
MEAVFVSVKSRFENFLGALFGHQPARLSTEAAAV